MLREYLQQRAALLSRIRTFFSARGLTEVETPLLAAATVTDPFVHSLSVTGCPATVFSAETACLQTSPEYAMKRLLVQGSGSIFQLCKAFRADATGRMHHVEFTLLEWYRLGVDHYALMDEMDAFLQAMLAVPAAQRISYRAAFLAQGLPDPHAASDETLARCVADRISLAAPAGGRATLLDLLMTHCIEPCFDSSRPVFVYDFPACQAALARLREEDPPVASRFEVYCGGMELANGFHELQDAAEQRSRFAADQQQRALLGLPAVAMDESFLSALEKGLPDCAGVALGVDRLLMIALNKKHIVDVIYPEGLRLTITTHPAVF